MQFNKVQIYEFSFFLVIMVSSFEAHVTIQGIEHQLIENIHHDCQHYSFH